MNPLERAVSTDVMRAQSFGAASISQFLQALFDNGAGTDDVQAAASYIPNVAAGTPSSGEVFSGLLFAPVGGSVAAGVGAGVVGIFDPDAAPSTDDSQWKLINDPGTVTNTLSLSPNASGSLRIDVIECSRVQPDNIIETDSRDVFNTVTGLFAAATVNKVSQAQLQYRIRTGTPGAGFPGGAAGWLPLAVASVPTGTTVWDTVTIWDVRPLLADRLYLGSTATRDLPAVTRCMAQVDATNHASQSQTTGNIEVQLNGRWLGGQMMSSCPQGTGLIGTLADALYVDLDDAQNRSASGAISTTGFNYVYISTPFGLPRWAKYTKGPTGRVPRSPRGIVVASAVAPDLAYGTPNGGQLNLPPCLQNAGNTAVDTAVYPPASVCILARLNTSTPATKGGLVATGGIHFANKPTAANAAAVGGGSGVFTINPGTDFPSHARAIHCMLTGTFTVTGTVTSYYLDVGTLLLQNGFGSVLTLGTNGVVTAGTYMSGIGTIPAGVYTWKLGLRIPLLGYYQLAGGPPGTATPGNASNLAINWTPLIQAVGGGTFVLTTGGLQVHGWELIDAD